MNNMNEMTLASDTIDLAFIESTAKRLVLADQIATAMCRASLLPDHLRCERIKGEWKPLDPEQVKSNCILIINQALRWGVDPFAILPSTFVVGGKLGFDGKLVAAIVNKLGGLTKRLSYEFSGSGDGRTVTVSGQLEGESEPRTVSVTVKDAKTDNAIWTKDPDQKLVYTGATKWARRHCPHVILGIISDDEPLGEVIDAPSRATWLPKETVQEPLKPQPETPADPIDLSKKVEQLRRAIAAASDEEELQRVADKISAELAMADADRQALRNSYIKRRNEITKTPVA